jgi:AAA+ superfamily predicted ATPase
MKFSLISLKFLEHKEEKTAQKIRENVVVDYEVLT